MPVTRTATDSDTPGRTEPASRRSPFRPKRPGILPVLLLLFAALLTGCRSDEKPEAPPAPKPDTSYPEPYSEEDSQPPATAESVDEVLRDVLNVYQHDMLKYYSDRGYIRTVYESDNRTYEIRYPVSVTLQKPNYLRMEVVGGLLVCDGEYLWGTIDSPLYNGQVLKVKAPHIFSSIREFYPDLKLGIAMNLPIPQNIFWAPPQLILMMAREPLKTLIGTNAFVPTPAAPGVRLLPPRYLRFDRRNPDAETIACDRVSVNSPQGGRVFWINRETKGIVRIELPIEQMPVQTGIDRILEITMDFPDQIISDEVPPSETVPPPMFTVKNASGVVEVDHFVSAELGFYGHRVPPLKLQPLLSGDPPIQLDEPRGHIRVYVLWGGGGDSHLVWERSKDLLKKMARTAAMFTSQPNIEFYAVNVDDSSRSDAAVLSDYGELSLRFPLYRVNSADLKRPPIGIMSKPSLVIIDGNGIVQKYYNQLSSHVPLQSNLVSLSDGKDIYKTEIAAFEAAGRGYEELLRSAEESDYYATNSEMPGDYVEYIPASSPENMTLTRVWEQILPDAANPLVITDDGGPVSDVIPAESVLVPYNGSMIAVLDTEGKLLRSQPTNAGEPVSFIRTVRAADGRRYFAASSFLDTHKVSIFGEKLELINTVNLASVRQQWVADALLNDENEDGVPELLVALCGDSVSNMIPVHGIYAIATRAKDGSDRSKIFWKDEFVMSPYQLGFIRKSIPGGESRRTLMAMNAPSDDLGVLIENDIDSGRRLKTIDTPEDISILWFTPPDDARDRSKATESFAALIKHDDSSTPCFAILSLDGKVLSETELTGCSWNTHTDRIIAGELDKDGRAEWIVPTREGEIWIFEEDGTLFDKFSIGREVTGVAIADWKDGTYLIVSHNMGVIAFKIDLKKNPETKDKDEE